jgi:hypothetical protein
MLMIQAARDARYLDLISCEEIEDRRNAEPILYLDDEDRRKDAACWVSRGGDVPCSVGVSAGAIVDQIDNLPALPRLLLSRPVIPQLYHLETWVEKSTVNDILEPLARRYGMNLVYAVGEMSLTRCHQLVRRAQASGKPVRILYVSDFDPAGQSMPVAVARKIEFIVWKEKLDIDIQLRPVVLTHDQCCEYRLPRTPIKEGERRAAAFEARFGEGATELDALEALHPGELKRILEQEIARYYDHNLDQRVRETCCQIDPLIADINDNVRAAHALEIETVEDEHQILAERLDSLRDELQAELDAVVERFEPSRQAIQAELDAVGEHFDSLRQAMQDDLQAEAPDLNDIEWPQPIADEDFDPLFDSTRDYVEQVDRYKEHQGKPTTRRGRNGTSRGALVKRRKRQLLGKYEMTTRTCAECGGDFETHDGRITLCSETCKRERRLKHMRNYNRAYEARKKAKGSDGGASA